MPMVKIEILGDFLPEIIQLVMSIFLSLSLIIYNSGKILLNSNSVLSKLLTSLVISPMGVGSIKIEEILN